MIKPAGESKTVNNNGGSVTNIIGNTTIMMNQNSSGNNGSQGNGPEEKQINGYVKIDINNYIINQNDIAPKSIAQDKPIIVSDDVIKIPKSKIKGAPINGRSLSLGVKKESQQQTA